MGIIALLFTISGICLYPQIKPLWRFKIPDYDDLGKFGISAFFRYYFIREVTLSFRGRHKRFKTTLFAVWLLNVVTLTRFLDSHFGVDWFATYLSGIIFIIFYLKYLIPNKQAFFRLYRRFRQIPRSRQILLNWFMFLYVIFSWIFFTAVMYYME